MSASFFNEGSGPGGHDLWDPTPVVPPTPSAPPKPEEFLWSRPERLRDSDTDVDPRERTGAGGRPVKKAARKASKRSTTGRGERKRR